MRKSIFDVAPRAQEDIGVNYRERNLILLLNSTKGTHRMHHFTARRKAEFESLVNRIDEVLKMLQALPSWNADQPFTGKVAYRANAEINELNQVFSKCSESPTFELDASATGLCVHRVVSHSVQSVMESSALLALASLVQEQRFDRLRRCTECSDWYIAKRPTAKTCGSSCRQHKYQDKESTKKKRRKYYRENLSPKTALNPRVKSRKSAGMKKDGER
jgi:hypothetical protein